MESGKVSLIIPVYNSEKFLSETLDSISRQSYSNFECICVDDGSTDESLNIASEYTKKDDRFISYKRPDSFPKGGNACRNFGFSISEGEFVQWFDSDDLMSDNFLEEKVSLLKSTDYNYVISRTGYFTTSPQELTEYDQNLFTNNIYYDFLTYKTKFFTPGPMFKRLFLSNMDLFDLELKRHQEKEFFFRVLLKDKSFGIIDKASIFRRMHDSQLSSSFNNPRLKLKHEFFCWNTIFKNYRNSNEKNKKLDGYFKDLFMKYSFRFLKFGELKLSFICLKNLIN